MRLALLRAVDSDAATATAAIRLHIVVASIATKSSSSRVVLLLGGAIRISNGSKMTGNSANPS